MKKNYDLSALMTYAWKIFRNEANKCDCFGEALRRAWRAFDVAESNRAKIEKAIAESGITERVRSWYGWTTEGRKVMHEQKAVLKVPVETPEKGVGVIRTKAFFTYSQTDLFENVA